MPGKRKHLIITDSEGSDDENLEEGILSLVAPAKKPKQTPVKSTQSSSDSDTSESDDEWTLGSKQKGKKTKQTPSQSRQSGSKLNATLAFSSDEEDDDDDDGEMDTSGKGSGYNMDSSEESDVESPRMFDDGLDEHLFGDAEDRIRLSNMKEAEREAELYERYMKREAAKTRFEIKQELQKKSVKHDLKSSKESKRLREKDKPKKSSRDRAIEELQARRLSDKKKKEKRQSQPDYSMEDIFEGRRDQEEEEEGGSKDQEQPNWGEEDESEAEPPPPQSISTIEQLTKMKVSRFRMEKLVHMPFFDKMMKGAFVRIGIGNHDGRPVYRVAEVTALIETPKVYSLGKGRTNKGLKLKHGKQERIFRMEYVSNSNFTDSEFKKWIAELEKYDIPLPTESDVKQKLKDFQEAKNFEFTDEHVDHIISEKSKFRRNPVNYAMTKNRLMMEKDHAEQTGEKGKVESLKRELEEIEERAEELDKQRSRGLSAIGFINERNRQRNAVAGEAALKEEVAARERTDDPFTRRKCMPRSLVALPNTGDGEAKGLQRKEELGTPKAGVSSEATSSKMQSTPVATETPPQASTSSNLPGSQQSTPVTPKTSAADMFSAHDFDIHIELPTSAASSVVVRTNPRSQLQASSDGQQRRSLNLSDYKRRRGLI